MSTPGPSRGHAVGEVSRRNVMIDVMGVSSTGDDRVSVDVFWRKQAPDRPIGLWWLLPGGGMTKRYWDLEVSPGDDSYSMARYLARRGYLVATLDHLGVGDSTRPVDGFSLSSDVLGRVAADAFREVRARLETEGIGGSPPLPVGAPSIGCGHSMGGGILLRAQHSRRSHEGLCLLGFSGRGLPHLIEPEHRDYIGRPERLRRDVAELARARNSNPYVPMPRGRGEMLGVPSDPSVRAALRKAQTDLLAVAGYTTLFPGHCDEVTSAVDVPLFLAGGDNDIGSGLHDVAADFTSSDDVTLYRLSNSGHNHNVSPTRERLWARLDRWARSALMPWISDTRNLSEMADPSS